VRGRNFGDLTPGDGEQIMAAVTWRELVFIFKETKFFVLWGEGTASDGTPIFNFREVVNSVGLASKLAVAAGRDGVYFFNRRGVYRTTGGNPELLSDPISPLWTGNPADYYRGQPINLSQLGLVRMVVAHGAAVPRHPDRLERSPMTGCWSTTSSTVVDGLRHRRVRAGRVPSRRPQRAPPRLRERPAARRASPVRRDRRPRRADHLALALGLVGLRHEPGQDDP
jgi:hypothetical protein